MKDNIYSVPRAQLGDFTFDDKVAKVFPDMDFIFLSAILAGKT